MSTALGVIWTFYKAGLQHKSLPVWMHRMSDAISCAISGGLQFEEGDFREIMSWKNRAWVGINTFEYFYTLATGMRHRDEVRNQSALESLELYLKRPVYNYDGGRLYVGRQLFLTDNLPSTHKKGWRDSWWRVSSFQDGADPHVTMIGVSDAVKGQRCKLTPEDLRAMEKVRKGLK